MPDYKYTYYEYHPIANAFPMMEIVELTELAQDIDKKGLLEPVVLYEGKILDGRNRYEACDMCRVNPSFTEYTGDDPVGFVLSKNLTRRHLTASQKAVVALDLVPLFEEEARKRQATSGPGIYGGKPVAALMQQPVCNEPHITRARAAEKAAATVGIGERYVYDAKRIQQSSPELLEQVRDGIKTIPQAIREINRTERLEVIKDTPPMTGKYRVIYADPPWEYGQIIDKYGPADNHYNTMSTEDICALPVSEIAEDNAVLWIWATSPKIEEALQVTKAWGFTYKAMFVWDKIKHNYGHYNSVRHELLFIATKGSCTPDVPVLTDSVVSIERTEHSKKPAEFRELIDNMYPYGARVELFAREPAEGWNVWGAESERN